jgi:uroporphyrinogen-III synthase
MTSILVTRPAGKSDGLQTAGYRVHVVPTVATQPLEFDEPDLTKYDWVVLTSAAGVEALGRSPSPLRGEGRGEGLKLGLRWAAVGEATGRALRAAGIEPSLIPAVSNGLALANALPDVEGKRILLVRASAASADLPERLRERGAIVDDLAAYLTIEGPASSSEPLKSALADPELAAVVFASGSAVRGYIALGGSTSVPAITIGPHTTRVAQDLGFRVIAEARTQSAEALAAAVAGAIPVEEKNRA